MKTLGVIQCRVASQRLPQKALLPLGDLTLLEWVIRRSLRAKRLDLVVLATGQSANNDPLEEVAHRNSIDIYRGSEDDVLARYADVIAQLNPRTVVRITGDNPLSDPTLMDLLIEYSDQEDLDYSYIAKAPYGVGVDVFKAQELTLAARLATEPRQREHINCYFLDNCLRFRIGSLSIPDTLARNDISLTVDTEEDYQKFRELVAQLSNADKADLEEVIKTYDGLGAGQKFSA